MDRRDFLKGSTVAGITGLIFPHATAVPTMTTINKEKESSRDFFFNKEGKFKILQLTDTHYIAGDPRSVRALDNVNQMLDLEKPDLVIHTGDIVFGKPAEQSVREILAPMAERKIPFAVTFGNQD